MRKIYVVFVLLFGVFGANAQAPYIEPSIGLGQYGYLEKDATTYIGLNSDIYGNISQMFARTFLNGSSILTYGSAINTCGPSGQTQNTVNYNFGASAVAGQIAYTSVHVDYCGGTNSYGGNTNQVGFNERQHYIFDVTDRPADLSANVVQLNSTSLTSTANVVMSLKIDFGAVADRTLSRLFVQNTGTLTETEIGNDGFSVFYEPATGSEVFDGTEPSKIILGANSGSAVDNIYGDNAINLPVPAGGLRIYVVLKKFASCLTTARTVQVSSINDGMSFTPGMNGVYTNARVGQQPVAPSTINVIPIVNTTPFSGNYYIPSTCYPTLASFIAALNGGLVGGAITVNVAAGYTEPAPAGGYAITQTGTAANTIVFQKFGAGTNPTFTASAAQVVGNVGDAIFKIIGADYVTLDGFTIQENAANTISASNATNNMTEFGVALFYAIGVTTDGAQNNTIQNCNISLNKTYTNTFGIYSNTNHNYILATTPITTLAGGNNNNKIYNNTISNINIGIALLGVGTLYSAGNDIGGTAASTGNTITNQGSGSATLNTYPGMPGTSVMSIVVSHSTGTNISYNNITGTTCAVNNYGILLRNSGTSSTLTHTTTISNNTITGLASSATVSYNLFGIWNDGMGGANHILSINNNTINTFSTSNAGFVGAVNAIWSSGSVNTLNINSNTISGFTIAGAALPTSTTARCGAVKSSGIVTGAINIGTNAISNFAFNNTTTGDIVMLDVNGNYTGTCTINANTVNTVAHTGTGAIYGYWNVGSPTGALNVTNNTFKDISITGAGTNSKINFVVSGTGASQVLNINGNTIENLTVNTAVASSGITGILTSISATVTVNNNIIKNLSSLSTNIGIQTAGGATTHTISGNTIDGMASNAGGGVNHYGLRIGSATGTTNIYNNKVYNITTGTSTNAYIYAIEVSNGTFSNVYNNMVADLKMPAVSVTAVSCLRGITISGATNSNVYNNSVYLTGTSSGTDFSSAAFGYSATTTTDARNNIFTNNVVPKGQGFSAAIMRYATGTNGTISPNYASTSNNNCLYAQSVTNGVIYVEGQYTGGGPTNIIPANCFDLTPYKAYMVGGRETASFSEIPPFASTTVGSMDLHFAASPTSGCINGGQTIALTNPDIDANARPIGAAYEIGADEVAGTNIDRTPPVIAYTSLSDVGCATPVASLSATITDANALGSGATAPRLYYKKLSDATNTIATANNNSVNGWKYVVTPTGASPYSFAFDYTLLPGGLVSGDVIQYFVAAQDVAGNVATTSATVAPCATTVAFTSPQTVSAPPTINQFAYRGSISGAVSIGTGGGQTYPTLSGVGGLFDAINRGFVSGDITATVSSNTVETGAVALNEWTEYNTGTCALTGTTVYRLTVQSDGSVRNLVGTDLVYNATTLQAMINLNGADRVTFTGGTGTQRNLVFRSTNIAPTSCVPVFQMGNVNGSTGIIIKNCDIQSNGTSGVAPLSACIYVTGTGTNNNNLFDNNDIHDATAGTTGNPRYAVYAENNANTVLQITNNKIYNINTTGIQIGVGATPTIGNGQSITGNSIYSTGVGAYNTTFYGIDVRGTAASGHTIINNFIGGAASVGGVSGSPFTNSTITTFKGIYLPYHAFTTVTNITGNAITNINLSNATGVAFSGIDFTGLVNCNNNTVGHSTDPLMGITIGATTATAASNNYGIIGGGGTAVSGINFTNNTVKYIKHNTNGAAATASRLLGIYSFYIGAAGVTININNNTVAEMASNMKNTVNLYTSGNTFATGGIICGILSGTASTSNIDVKNNTIFNLGNTGVNSTNIPNVVGIAIDGNTPSNIASNRIYGLTNQSPGSAANGGFIAGIRLQPSTSVVANNMITLTNGANTNSSRIIGIFDGANNLDVYYNSIYIGGSQSAFGNTGVCSAPYVSIASGGTHNIRNNIFQNARTTTAGIPGGVNFHYALAITATGPTVASNYNDLVAADVTKLCLYNTTSYAIAGWRALATPATPDVNSQTVTPIFVDQPNGDLHLDPNGNCLLLGRGLYQASVLVDYDNDVRKTGVSPNGPDIGADEISKTTNWVGTTTAWATASNWSSGVVPNSSTTNIVIPNSGTMPTISLGDTWQVGNVTITTGGTGLLTNNGTLNVAGAISATTGINSEAGTIILNSTGSCAGAQTISGASFTSRTIQNLILSNTYGTNPAVALSATLNDTLKISGALSFGNVSNKTLNTNDNLTLLSSAAGTARLADLTNAGANSGNDVIGKATIERFLYAKKAWRLLATPVKSSALSITDSWREGIAGVTNTTSTGYGTQITGPASSTGMDETTQRGSLKWYDQTNQSVYQEITNTANAIARREGYYVFVRGDRSKNTGSGAAAATILRIKGEILTGTQPDFDITAGNFATIGNPYPSAIDLRNVSKTGGMVDAFTAWNPNSALQAYGVGGFETYNFNGTNYERTPSGSGVYKNEIQSGEAIFMQAFGTNGKVIFEENDKISTSALFSRNGSAEGRTGVTTPTLEVNLFTKDANATSILADGVKIDFDNLYSNSIDNKDVRKVNNTFDNLAVKSNTSVLVVERRKSLVATDSIFLNLSNTRVAPYRFEIDPSVLSNTGLEAFLEDKFLQTATPVSLSAVTNVAFDITSNAASKVADRFMIVFKQAPTVNFTTIAATRNADKTITVNWGVHNERNVSTYSVEHSNDGVNFSPLTAQTALANNGTNPTYSKLDVAATSASNWYRVKANMANASAKYSGIAMVGALPADQLAKPAISVNPNPVKDQTINIKFTNKVGDYKMTLVNNEGRVVYNANIVIANANVVKTIALGKAIAPGQYQLTITNVDGKKEILSVLVL